MLRGSHGALQRAGQLETGGGRPYLLYSGGYKRLSRCFFLLRFFKQDLCDENITYFNQFFSSL